MRLVLRTQRRRGLGCPTPRSQKEPPIRCTLNKSVDHHPICMRPTERHLLTAPQVPFTDTFGSFRMAQKTLVRPIGLVLNAARTQPFVRPFSTVLDSPIDPRTQQVTPPTTRKSSVFEDAVGAAGPRINWTREEITEVYNTPLIKLTYAAVCLSTSYLGRPF